MVTQHHQVPFRTLDGRLVTVDMGMHRIMTILRDAGIETSYSCENNMGQAYILMPLRAGKKFERLIRGSEFDLRRKMGRRRIEITLYKNKGCHRLFETILHLSRGAARGYRTEYLVENHYGLRAAYRWPAQHNTDLQMTLEEKR